MTDSGILKATLTRAERTLEAAGIRTARADARMLAAHIAGLSRGTLESALITGRDLPFDVTAFDDLVSERARRIPLQHLTGSAPFRQLELAVGPGVFIPRPETETVTQVALDELAKITGLLTPSQASAGGGAPVIAVDLCTGSGAIALSLALESEADEVHAVEISDLAFAWARHNYELLITKLRGSSLEHLHLHLGDATAPEMLSELDGRVSLVVSNPPYIPPYQVPVDDEVREHDPEIALYGRGEDGLKVPRAVLNRAQTLLRPGGTLVMEHAEVQGALLRRIARETGWVNIETRTDLAGRPRMLYATSAGPEPKMGE